MEKVDTDAFVVQGVSNEVRNDDPGSIGAVWAEFQKMELPGKLIRVLSEDVVCVYHDYRGTHVDPYRMTVGFRVPMDAVDVVGLSKVTVPAQTMQIFDVTGPQPETLVSQWKSIWDLPIHRSYVADYDIYDSTNPDRAIVHVGIATDISAP